MNSTLVDCNALIDLFDEGSEWRGWADAMVTRAASRTWGGQRTTPLPDFYVGAHAAVTGHSLLTRDPARYRLYFPKLRVIAP